MGGAKKGVMGTTRAKKGMSKNRIAVIQKANKRTVSGKSSNLAKAMGLGSSKKSGSKGGGGGSTKSKGSTKAKGSSKLTPKGSSYKLGSKPKSNKSYDDMFKTARNITTKTSMGSLKKLNSSFDKSGSRTLQNRMDKVMSVKSGGGSKRSLQTSINSLRGEARRNLNPRLYSSASANVKGRIVPLNFRSRGTNKSATPKSSLTGRQKNARAFRALYPNIAGKFN